MNIFCGHICYLIIKFIAKFHWNLSKKFEVIAYIRPWHDTGLPYHLHKSRKKEAWVGNEKPAFCSHKILNSWLRIHFNWFNRINFKLILLTLLFKSFFKTNLNSGWLPLVTWYIFNHYAMSFCKYDLSKKIR